MVGGGRPLLPKILGQTDRTGANVGSCAGHNQPFNLISSGVLEPQVAKNRYLPLTGGIALTTVCTLTCYTCDNDIPVVLKERLTKTENIYRVYVVYAANLQHN